MRGFLVVLAVLCFLFFVADVPLTRTYASDGVVVTVPATIGVTAVGNRVGWWWSNPTPTPKPAPVPAPVVPPACTPATYIPEACTPATATVDTDGGRRHPVARIVMGAVKGAGAVIGHQRRAERRANRQAD